MNKKESFKLHGAIANRAFAEIRSLNGNVKLTKREALKAIDKAYSRLSMCCCQHTHDWDRYLTLIDQEEKGHRKFRPDHLRCGLTKGQAVNLFAGKEVFERFVPAHSGEKIYTPEAKDYFRVRGSVFAACSIADTCSPEILKEFNKPEMAEWLEIKSRSTGLRNRLGAA